MDARYHEVNTEDSKTSVQSILKQSFIASAVWMQYFLAGLAIGTPTVFIPQLRREANSTEVDAISSWLYAAPSMSMLPFVLFVPIFTKKVGRKIPQIITSIVTMIAFIILYYSTSVYHILIMEIIQGYLQAGNLTFTVLSITEYTSSRLRGFFLTFTGAGFSWGLWTANAVGTFYHYRNIALVGMCGSIYTLTVTLWPESPFWLASKGRIEESKASFRWIHGHKAEKGLQEMILAQEKMLLLEQADVKGLSSWVRCPEFYKPLFLSIILVVQNILSGKMVCCLYILDIFKKITSSEEAAYRAMLILDGVTLLCVYVGTYLAKILKRRTLFMSSSFVGIIFLFTTSLYLFLVREKLFEVNNYITLALLTAFSVSISVGPMILWCVIYGELISSKFQASSYTIISLVTCVAYFVWLKITPNIFETFGLDGSFLLYGVTCGLCTIYLFVYLPETKDKTRWELDNVFVKRKISTDDVLPVINS